MNRIACKLCIISRGLKGSEVSALPKTDEEMFEHLEQVHGIPVRRDGETEEECMERFNRNYPLDVQAAGG